MNADVTQGSEIDMKFKSERQFKIVIGLISKVVKRDTKDKNALLYMYLDLIWLLKKIDNFSCQALTPW